MLLLNQPWNQYQRLIERERRRAAWLRRAAGAALAVALLLIALGAIKLIELLSNL